MRASEYPKDDWTFDQFVETAKKLTKTAGKGTFGYQMPTATGIATSAGSSARASASSTTSSTRRKAQFSHAGRSSADARLWRTTCPTPSRPRPALPTRQRREHDQHRQVRHEVRRAPGSCPQLNSQKLRDENKNVRFDVVRMPKGAVRQSAASRLGRGCLRAARLEADNAEDAAWKFAAYLGERGRQQDVL
jgi:hypothetical protein